MTLTGVFSEQGGESKWRDCPQSSYLMVIKHGGIDMPFAWQERERFENAEGIPESQQELGLVTYALADVASRELYGVTAHKAIESELPALLMSATVAIALTGQGAGLPSGFTGYHSVCVVPLGNGQCALYDPLRAMGAKPEFIGNATILAWHRRLAQDIRYTREGEFTEAFMVPFTYTGPAEGTGTVDPKPNVRFCDTAGEFVVKPTQPAYDLLAAGTMPDLPLGIPNAAAYMVNEGGKFAFALARNFTAITLPVTDPAAIAAAVNAATAPLAAKITAAKAALG